MAEREIACPDATKMELKIQARELERIAEQKAAEKGK
jgi:hypothetical protein